MWDQLVKGAQRLINAGDEFYVKSLYRLLLGREPDAAGLQSNLDGLKNGMSHEQLRQQFLNSDEYKIKLAPVAAPPPPITQEIVKEVARAYVAQHPELADRPSYEDTAAVARLREGVIAALKAKGYRAGRILGPDGKPYDQGVGFGNQNDGMAHSYRVTAGGGRIIRAIDAGYEDDPLPWSDVH
jgi:hypothetical protein